MAMATYNQTDFEENEMSSENISSLGPLKELKSLDFNDMVNVISYFSMSLGEWISLWLRYELKEWQSSSVCQFGW